MQNDLDISLNTARKARAAVGSLVAAALLVGSLVTIDSEDKQVTSDEKQSTGASSASALPEPALRSLDAVTHHG